MPAVCLLKKDQSRIYVTTAVLQIFPTSTGFSKESKKCRPENGERPMRIKNINMAFQPFVSILRLSKTMKQFSLLAILIGSAALGHAQKIDSIYFNLYTDSLKKGTHNYINVDGKTSDGKWKPLTGKEIDFTSSYGNFEGNDLVLPGQCTVEKLTVKAVLKANPSVWKEVTIWIKKKPDDERLPTQEEILNGNKPQKKKSKNKSSD